MAEGNDELGTEERSRDRSPQFPFIPLEKAIERARIFEAQYKKSAGRIANVLPVWGYSAKSSGGLQTIATLLQFGLMDDEGVGPERKVKISDLGYRILKDERPGKKEEAIKEVALKPKPLAEHWELWKGGRPPDVECLSELTIERGYTEEAAKRFLKVYDDTITFAKLSEGDKLEEEKPEERTPPTDTFFTDFFRAPTPTPKPKEESKPMPERVVFAQEIDAQQSLKLIVAGAVDESLLDALEDFVEFQRTRLKRQRDKANEQPPSSETGEPN